jgi:hypothetical protein
MRSVFLKMRLLMNFFSLTHSVHITVKMGKKVSALQQTFHVFLFFQKSEWVREKKTVINCISMTHSGRLRERETEWVNNTKGIVCFHCARCSLMGCCCCCWILSSFPIVSNKLLFFCVRYCVHISLALVSSATTRPCFISQCIYIKLPQWQLSVRESASALHRA